MFLKLDKKFLFTPSPYLCPLSMRKCAKMSVFREKIVKILWAVGATKSPFLYQNLGAPLITIAIFRFLQTSEVFFLQKAPQIAIQAMFSLY